MRVGKLEVGGRVLVIEGFRVGEFDGIVAEFSGSNVDRKLGFIVGLREIKDG